MTMLDHRPAETADRAVPGHWEGDLITGASNRAAIGTLVERTSRFTILLHLPGGRHGAEDDRDALVHALRQIPPGLRRSLARDQGKEMALHGDVAAALTMPVFFCDKASPGSVPATRIPTGCCGNAFLRDRPARTHRRAAFRRGRRAERPATQDTRLGHPHRTADPARRHGGNTAPVVRVTRKTGPAGRAARMRDVANMRRRDREPPPGQPEIQQQPGMADEMLRELAPLLAEEGIDLNDPDQAPDPDTPQPAVERQNMTLFTPSGRPASSPCARCGR